MQPPGCLYTTGAREVVQPFGCAFLARNRTFQGRPFPAPRCLADMAGGGIVCGAHIARDARAVRKACSRGSSQSRRPHGDDADAVAAQMNRTNQATNLQAIEVLDVSHHDRVLEIGPGNGRFASEIVNRGVQVTYAGIDWSEKMVASAKKLNRDLVNAGRVEFVFGSSSDLPFGDNCFTKVLAVHTLYFWEEPQLHLAQIRRVLCPGGLFCLCFGDQGFMKRLPFTKSGFALYDAAAAQGILNDAGFAVQRSFQHVEHGESQTGEFVEKLVHILVCAS